MKYQNTGFENHRAQFTEVTAVSNQMQAAFQNQIKEAPIAGGTRVPMRNGSLVVKQPFSPESCDPCAVGKLTASVKLSWNFYSATQLTELRAEMNRLFDLAVQDYNLTSGLVPPVYATFEG